MTDYGGSGDAYSSTLSARMSLVLCSYSPATYPFLYRYYSDPTTVADADIISNNDISYQTSATATSVSEKIAAGYHFRKDLTPTYGTAYTATFSLSTVTATKYMAFFPGGGLSATGIGSSDKKLYKRITRIYFT